MPKVRPILSNGSCSKFHALSSSANILEIFDKVTESLKVGTFFESQCISVCMYVRMRVRTHV